MIVDPDNEDVFGEKLGEKEGNRGGSN